MIGVGALGGVVGAIRPAATAHMTVKPNFEATSVPAAAAGFAELAVRRWMEADAQSQTLARLFVDRPQLSDLHHRVVVNSTNTVAASTIVAGYWSLTIAVDFTPVAIGAVKTTWFVQLGVANDRAGRYVALTTPAVVSDPRPATPLPSLSQAALTTPSPEDPVAVTVTGFLAALLTGNGQVDRYLAPAVQIDAVSPSPFETVRLDGIASTRTGAAVVVRVSASARSSSGDEWMLGYELALVERDGQWQVRSMRGSPSLAPTATRGSASSPSHVPSSSTTTTAAMATSPGA
jgi:hypothetical protein